MFVCRYYVIKNYSSAKSLVQLGNTFTQSSCGCLKKCLQLSKLLPLPSHKLCTFPKIHKKKKVQFGQESCPAGEYLHSEQLWMLEKVFAALNTTPTTIPQTPHISKNPQKKKLGNNFVREAEDCRWELKARNSDVQLCASYDSSCFVAAGLVVDLAT